MADYLLNFETGISSVIALTRLICIKIVTKRQTTYKDNKIVRLQAADGLKLE